MTKEKATMTRGEQQIMTRLEKGPLPVNHVGGLMGLYSSAVMARLHTRQVVRLTTVDGQVCWIKG